MILKRVSGVCWLAFAALLAAGCQPQPAGKRAVSAGNEGPSAVEQGQGRPSTPATQPTTSRVVSEEPTAPEGAAEEEQAAAPAPSTETAAQSGAEKPPPQGETNDEIEKKRLAEAARLLAERRPKRPLESWVVFREAFNELKDATCSAEWTGGNRLEVHTDNIKRLTVYLTRLPAGAPQRGPWNLQIDHQGIQITGVRGKVLDLVRSKSGNWTVDVSKAKKRE